MLASYPNIESFDPELAQALEREARRQEENGL